MYLVYLRRPQGKRPKPREMEGKGAKVRAWGRALMVLALGSYGRDLSRRGMWSLWLLGGEGLKRGGLEIDIRGKEGLAPGGEERVDWIYF